LSLYKTCGWWKNFDCIFESGVKSYVRNTINLSCAKILFPSVIEDLMYIRLIHCCLSHTPWYLKWIPSREASRYLENFLGTVKSYAMYKRNYFIFILPFRFSFYFVYLRAQTSNTPVIFFLRSYSAYLYFTEQLLSFMCVTQSYWFSLTFTCTTQFSLAITRTTQFSLAITRTTQFSLAITCSKQFSLAIMCTTQFSLAIMCTTQFSLAITCTTQHFNPKKSKWF
jgi:hypothetical protein